MKYQDYGIADFIKDQFFVEWVSNPNSKANESWIKLDDITSKPVATRFLDTTVYSYDPH